MGGTEIMIAMTQVDCEVMVLCELWFTIKV